MIIVDTFIKLNVSDEFKNLFSLHTVRAIMAVVIIYWKGYGHSQLSKKMAVIQIVMALQYLQAKKYW